MSARQWAFGGSEADSEATHPLLAFPETLPSEFEDWPTTRRFARSQHGNNAAFPDSADYANSVEPPTSDEGWPVRLNDFLLVAVAVLALVAGACGLLSGN